VVSPVLSNVYLHYVLDLWFEKVIKPRCRGEACLIRDADDYICAFEDQAEAERFYAALGPRLEKFGLTLAAEAAHGAPEAAGVLAALHPVVSGESPSAAQRAVEAVERQTPGVLQLLRSAREQREPQAIL
jgi:hypothetical protein